MNKNILAFGAHPDDVEFGCGGTLLLLKGLGYKITIIDLTRGEKAKYGATERLREAEKARKILGVERKILNFGDKNISLSEKHKKEVKEIIEQYTPSIIFAPYFKDKHTDHINTAKLVSEFFPRTIHYYISDVEDPNIGVDVTKTYKKKIEALDAHVTQIRPGDVEWTDKRHKSFGEKLSVEWGELFYIKNKIELPIIFRRL